MKRKLTILIGIIAVLAVFLYLQNNWISLTKLSITSLKLPGNFEGFRILQISDLHSKAFGKGQERLLKVIAGADPDMIVITGDIVDGRHYDDKPPLALVGKAVKIAPVYYVTGNHEWWSGKFPELVSRISEAGAVVLRDNTRKISIGDQSIYLTGLDDPESTGSIYNDGRYFEEKLHTTIPRLSADSFKVLLSHRPEAFYLYSGYDVDLVFSGHAHGGQFRLPFIGGLFSPDQGFFPKFTSGIYRDGNSAMVVSRGMGNSIIPLRLFNRPEVVLVTLHSSSREGTAGTSVSAEKGQYAYKQTGAKENSSPDSQVTGVMEQYLINEDGKTVQERILVPDGFERIKLEEGSFAEYLRDLPLKPHGSRVVYFNGEIKPADVYEAVVDLDLGKRDLQQCADSIIRLRAEYLYKKDCFDEITFHFTNGFEADYSTWTKGNRIKVNGNKASWVSQGAASKDYESFRDYLDMVFAYAGTLSLSNEMKTVKVEEMQPGDVFIQGGSPGHCLIVVDMAVNRSTGEKRFLLAQGYMPAQDIHILKNPGNSDGNPWYDQDFGESLNTPELEFSRDQLMRFE